MQTQTRLVCCVTEFRVQFRHRTFSWRAMKLIDREWEKSGLRHVPCRRPRRGRWHIDIVVEGEPEIEFLRAAGTRHHTCWIGSEGTVAGGAMSGHREAT